MTRKINISEWGIPLPWFIRNISSPESLGPFLELHGETSCHCSTDSIRIDKFARIDAMQHPILMLSGRADDPIDIHY